MAVNTAQIEAIAHQLLAVAGMFNPAVAGAATAVDAILKLFKSGQELNGLIKEIMEQTDANADDVMKAVIADYRASADGLQAALDAAAAAQAPTP